MLGPSPADLGLTWAVGEGKFRICQASPMRAPLVEQVPVLPSFQCGSPGRRVHVHPTLTAALTADGPPTALASLTTDDGCAPGSRLAAAGPVSLAPQAVLRALCTSSKQRASHCQTPRLAGVSLGVRSPVWRGCTGRHSVSDAAMLRRWRSVWPWSACLDSLDAARIDTRP